MANNSEGSSLKQMVLMREDMRLDGLPTIPVGVISRSEDGETMAIYAPFDSLPPDHRAQINPLAYNKLRVTRLDQFRKSIHGILPGGEAKFLHPSSLEYWQYLHWSTQAAFLLYRFSEPSILVYEHTLYEATYVVFQESVITPLKEAQ